MTPQQKASQEALNFVDRLNDALIFPLITFLLGIALLVFFYGLFEYLMNADNDEGRKTGRKHILWGLVGMVVMTSALAILRIAAATFGLGGDLDNLTNP